MQRAPTGFAAGEGAIPQNRTPPPGSEVAIGTQRVTQMLQQNPSYFGPYAGALQQASADPTRLQAKIADLESEPMFRRMLRQLEDNNSANGGITYSTEQ